MHDSPECATPPEDCEPGHRCLGEVEVVVDILASQVIDVVGDRVERPDGGPVIGWLRRRGPSSQSLQNSRIRFE